MKDKQTHRLKQAHVASSWMDRTEELAASTRICVFCNSGFAVKSLRSSEANQLHGCKGLHCRQRGVPGTQKNSWAKGE
eukprot:1143327-Pelagomonas_calceolata.AAC.3